MTYITRQKFDFLTQGELGEDLVNVELGHGVGEEEGGVVGVIRRTRRGVFPGGVFARL